MHLMLNLGCGKKQFPGFINVDSRMLPGVDFCWDMNGALLSKLPYADNAVGFIYMSHVFEHITNFFPLMSELYRVAINQAEVIIRLPHFLNHEAWIDPTHVRPWHWRSFVYFSQPKYHEFDYEYTSDFQPISYIHVVKDEVLSQYPEISLNQLDSIPNLVSEMIVHLKVIKPQRKRVKEELFHGSHKIVRNKYLVTTPDGQLI